MKHHNLVPLKILEAAANGEVQLFQGAWDDEGVYFYQAYRDEIANYALAHGRFGGPKWGSTRMTWIKPSFAWMLYRAGYGHKPGQTRILRIKLGHETVARLLSECNLSSHQVTDRDATDSGKEKRSGRIQWDPERDLLSPEQGKCEPRKMLQKRAIQIGVSGTLSELYVDNLLSIEDVTDLARAVGDAHAEEKADSVKAKMDILIAEGKILQERPYMPSCDRADLVRLGMLPGRRASMTRLGKGHLSK